MMTQNDVDDTQPLGGGEGGETKRERESHFLDLTNPEIDSRSRFFLFSLHGTTLCVGSATHVKGLQDFLAEQ